MKITVSIPGMHCSSCAALVKDVSGEFPAIKNINIDMGTKRVELDHAENFDMASWTKEVESLGEKYKIHKAA